jgi:hypothetical protein
MRSAAGVRWGLRWRAGHGAAPTRLGTTGPQSTAARSAVNGQQSAVKLARVAEDEAQRHRRRQRSGKVEGERKGVAVRVAQQPPRQRAQLQRLVGGRLVGGWLVRGWVVG